MKKYYSINVEKEYFNFAASHFLTFENGNREALHGHNYYVRVRGDGPALKHDMLFDFLKIKPIVKKICDSLDHKVLLPTENPLYSYKDNGANLEITLKCGTFFSIPKSDIVMVPIKNISAELLAEHIATTLIAELKQKFKFHFQRVEVEVEESLGQSAICIVEEE